MLRCLLAACAVAVLLLARPVPAAEPRAGWPDRITIGTASRGGTYFVYGAGLAGLLQRELGIEVAAVVTGGPVQNAALLQSGELDLGMLTLGPAWEAWTGESPLAPGVRHDRLRAVFPMYETPFQVIALARSGIARIADLQGRTVGLGPAGGTADAYVPRFLEVLGIDIVRRNGGASDLSQQLRQGRIDAFAFAAGLPITAFAEIEAAVPVTLFSFEGPQIDRLLKAFPMLSRFTIPPGTYRSVVVGQDTVAMWNFAVARADLPDSLVYAIAKAVMDHPDRMREIHPAAADTLAENALADTVLPFHPGAARYFRETGIALPEQLLPAETGG